jgi:hypothetical protein
MKDADVCHSLLNIKISVIVSNYGWDYHTAVTGMFASVGTAVSNFTDLIYKQFYV